MIKYRLNCKSEFCSDEKVFDGWFKNIEVYEKQKLHRLINCPICGSDNVEKLLNAPILKTDKKITSNVKENQSKNSKNNENFLGNINSDSISTLLRTLKKEVQKNSTFVGDKFISQVRSMKEGKIKEKPIHGHGTNREIKELKDEGIDVVNIPWITDDH